MSIGKGWGSRCLLAVVAGLTPLAMGTTARAGSFTFQTLNNANDPTFNQLLSINNEGTIAGYFGIGSTAHPNKGYTLAPPYGQGNYTNENFPGSFQTQVTGINNAGLTVGFYADTLNNNFGFVDRNNSFTAVIDPSSPSQTAGVNQLLGVNDNNQAAGFYTDAMGNNHSYVYNISTVSFNNLVIPNSVSDTAASIDNAGDVAGFYTDAGGVMHGYLDLAGKITSYDAPNSVSTQFLGLNNNGMAVGDYVDANNVMHGLEYNINTKTFTTIDDPNGIGTTTLNGINDKGQIVGFYVDGADNTDGVLITPSAVPEPSSLLMGALSSSMLGFGWLVRWRRRRVRLG